MTRTHRTGNEYTILLNGKFVDFFQADNPNTDTYRTRFGIHDAHWDAITATTAIKDAFWTMGINVEIERTWLMSEDTHKDHDELVYNIKTE